MAAYNAFIQRALTIPMNTTDYKNEINTIKYIATKNGYNPSTIDKLIEKRKRRMHNKNNNTNANNETKYISINYTNLLPETIKQQFKKTNTKISFKTNNNIQNILQNNNKRDIKSLSGIYKIKCDDCDKYYIGQTGRTFYQRFNEHKPKQNTKSKFAIHLIEENHNYSTFDNNLTPLHICKKGKIMDAKEEYEIYKASAIEQDIILNDKLTIKTNPLYETAIKYNYNRQ